MPDKPTARQRDAWILAAMTAPAVALCAGIGWQWALLGGGVSAALSLLCRRSDQPLRTQAIAALGPAAGKTVMALAALWNLLALAWLTQKAGSAFPETEDPVAIRLILLALAAFAVRKGETVPARCAAVIALVLAGLYALLLLAALHNVQPQWLQPWGSFRRALPLLTFQLLPSAAYYPGNGKGERGKAAAWPLLLLAPAIAAALTAGCLSPRLAAAEEVPFYEMVKGLSLFTVVERFEPLASVALTGGYFCAMSLLLCTARACFGGQSKSWQLAALAALSGAGSFCAMRVPNGIFALGAAIFWGILPLLIPLVVDCKKAGKKTKIKLDKTDSV